MPKLKPVEERPLRSGELYYYVHNSEAHFIENKPDEKSAWEAMVNRFDAETPLLALGEVVRFSYFRPFHLMYVFSKQRNLWVSGYKKEFKMAKYCPNGNELVLSFKRELAKRK